MVSIIIPVYNVQDYLARCVDSVLTQTYTDLEIILVDDGSIDISGDICDEYALHDARVRVIHKENGGLSDARNAGLDVARGNYVAFIDADDYVHPSFVELLLKTINETGAQIAVSTWQELKDGDKPRKVKTKRPRCTILTQEEAISSVFYQKKLAGVGDQEIRSALPPGAAQTGKDFLLFPGEDDRGHHHPSHAGDVALQRQIAGLLLPRRWDLFRGLKLPPFPARPPPGRQRRHHGNDLFPAYLDGLPDGRDVPKSRLRGSGLILILFPAHPQHGVRDLPGEIPVGKAGAGEGVLKP